jgi:integrase
MAGSRADLRERGRYADGSRQLLASFARLCERAGLGHWHPHELRHSGASLMLAQGTPLHVVSEVLGHASIAITKDVYGHLLEGDKRAAAESMSRALFGG